MPARHFGILEYNCKQALAFIQSRGMMSRINRSKLNIQAKGFQFTPFRPTEDHEILLKAATLKPDVELITFERGGERRALIMTEMHYHHVCQGELAGEPYLVTF